jgi:hypothetical protein
MRITLRTVPAAALATGLAFIALGCGADDGGASALTKTAFVERANQICADGNAKISAAFEDAFEEVGGRPSQKEAERLITGTVLPGIRRMVDEIGALTPPEEDADTIIGIIDESHEVLDAVGDDPALILESDEDPFAEVNKDLAAYGLTVCAEDSVSGPQE